MSEPILIKLGGIVICISTDDHSDRTALWEYYRHFIVYDEDANISLKFYSGDLPDISIWEELFYSGGIWRLWGRDDRYAVSFQIPVLQPPYHVIAILDSFFSNAVIYISKELENKYILPLVQKFLEFLMVSYLSYNQKGLMLHACAIKDGEKGRLFSGFSGAGKSTISRLWADRENVIVLSDDRVILRKRENRFFMYGTPWHGEARFVSPISVPLDEIFILQQSNSNQFKQLEPIKITSLLLARSFPTFWNPKGMEFTIEFLADLNRLVPCYELGFRPGPDVVDFVRCFSQASEATNRIIQ